MCEPWTDRQDAGKLLAKRLLSLADEHPVVVALPRGGVPVAREIAIVLGAPLDILAQQIVAAVSAVCDGTWTACPVLLFCSWG